MPVVIEPKNYIIGTALIYYRAVGVNTPWTSLGATLDDSTLRLTLEWFRPDNISGIKGPIMGLDVLRRANAEFEFTIPDITGSQMQALIPGARITAETHAPAGGGATTTLAAASLAGATSIEVASATGIAVGDYLAIGETPSDEEVEYRQVTAVDSTTISFRDELIFAHASGNDVIETTGDYRNVYESSLYTRMPDSAYKEWAIVAAGGNGYHELRLPRGIATADAVELSVSDSALSGATFTVGGRYLGSDASLSPFKLFIPAN